VRLIFITGQARNQLCTNLKALHRPSSRHQHDHRHSDCNDLVWRDEFPPIFTSKAWSENIDPKKLAIDAPKDMELNKISYSCTKRGYSKLFCDLL
jgi:hypothetical protein